MQIASKGGGLRANNKLAQLYEHGIEDSRSPAQAFELQKESYEAGLEFGREILAILMNWESGSSRTLTKHAKSISGCTSAGGHSRFIIYRKTTGNREPRSLVNYPLLLISYET